MNLMEKINLGSLQKNYWTLFEGTYGLYKIYSAVVGLL